MLKQSKIDKRLIDDMTNRLILRLRGLKKDILKVFKRKGNDGISEVCEMLDSVSPKEPNFLFMSAEFKKDKTSASYQPITNTITVYVDLDSDNELEREINWMTFLVFAKQHIKHELTHWLQYKEVREKQESFGNVVEKLQKQPEWEKVQRSEYLKDSDEIVSHAMDAVSEFRYKNFTTKAILNIIRFPKKSVSWTFNEYLDLFGHNNFVFKKFLKNMYNFLQQDLENSRVLKATNYLKVLQELNKFGTVI